MEEDRGLTQPLGRGGRPGGGPLLIASSTQITVNGVINANGGPRGASYIYTGGPGYGGYGGVASGGSGGAIRLVSNTIGGNNGTLTANGGAGDAQNGALGVVRLEAYTTACNCTLQGTLAQSTPFPLLLPTAGPPSAKVISINGVDINANPNTFPDITINTAAAVPVVIQTHNIPAAAVVNLTILDENGVADTVIPAPPLGNCDQNNVCTTTVNVVFPFGASRGLTKVTWTP